MPENIPAIQIRGARQHNLKNLDLDIPKNQLTVITGPSGSGKSSLAFHTLYAEGQRRYVETFSPYVRQFLDRMDKPAVDRIDNIPPAIAIEQKNNIRTTRSTVGTLTELNDYLKVIFPKLAKAFDPETGEEIKPDSPASIIEWAFENHTDENLLVTFPIKLSENATTSEVNNFLSQQGYLRVWKNDAMQRTDDTIEEDTPWGEPTATVIQDRVKLTAKNKTRLHEALEAALNFGKGNCALLQTGSQASTSPNKNSPITNNFSTAWRNPNTGFELQAPSASLFSFNSPLGACPECRGFGRIIGIDLDKAVQDPTLTIREGVIKPFEGERGAECKDDLIRCAREHGVDTNTPWHLLTKKQQEWVLKGEKGNADKLWKAGKWYGVRGFFDWMETKAYKMHVRVFLSRYRAYTACPSCNATRLKPEALCFKVEGKTLPDLWHIPLEELLQWFQQLPTENCQLETSSSLKHAMSEILSRLNYLNEVGLGYLTLDRPARTLSGGEIERVNLTTCLGASLTNTLFVLDEPTVGLHARDVNRLIKVMHNLRDKGNTVVVVEHEEAVMRQADNLIDIGPNAGEGGGEITFHGPLTGDLKSQISNHKLSGTLPYLTGEKSITPPKKRRKSRKSLRINGAHKHNISDQNISIPIGTFTCLTGVSGSGKSTFANDVIYLNLLKGFLQNTEEDPAFIKSLKGLEHLAGVERVDQSPLTRTPRSTPAVYAGAFDAIRELFALSDKAQSRGVKAGYFSFNSGDGRCQRCAGNGFEKVEMQFLSDLFITCPECNGCRYNSTALEIRYRGKSIADLLAMTITESLEFFAIEKDEPKSKTLTLKTKINKALKPLVDVGLGYLRLGQPLNTLSGGESQRIKLCQLLTKTKKVTENGQLLILDEPTTGLHFTDIEKLLQVFQNLVNAGHTLLVIEHNLDIIRSADHLIEVGPGAGTHGGEITFTGTPEEILTTDTETAKALSVEEASSLFGEQPSRAASPSDDSMKRLEVSSTPTPLTDESIPFTKKKSNLPHWTKEGATYAVTFRLADSLPKSILEAHTAQTNELQNQIKKAEAKGNKELTRDFKERLIEHYQTNLEGALNKQEGNAWMKDGKIAQIVGSAIQHFDGDRYDLGAWCVMPNHVHMIIKPKEGYEFSDILHSIKSFSAKEANKALGREGSFWQRESYDHVIRDAEDFYNQTKYIEKNPEVAGLKNWKWCNIVEEASSLFEDAPLTGDKRQGSSSKRLEASSTHSNEIKISGARENNLKDIDITIPRDEMVVVTGLSGSGKSTLAFDIIFAEGQRRFLDSMSPYARQFAGQLEKPDIDKIEGLPPTVAIEQRVSRGGGKSTVGTVTEIFHFLRLLYAKLGTQHCPDSGEPVVSQTVDAILTQLKKAFSSKKRTMLLAPLIRGRKGYHTDVAEAAGRKGIELLLVDGKLVETANFTALARYKEHDIFAVICDNKTPNAEQLDQALHMGRGQCAVATEVSKSDYPLQTFSTERVSPVTGVSFPELDPHHFSFNSARGWCPECRGYGCITQSIGKKKRKSAAKKANEFNSAMEAEIAEEMSSSADEETIKVTCPECKGDRLQTNARFVFIKDHNIAHISRLSVTEAADMLEEWSFADRSELIARDILPEITQRLRFLEKVGLNYLSLDRSADTLSGGESQRIRLAAQLGSNLTGVLYVLDEPTIGLHPRDNEQLLNTLEALRDRGNSLLIVEHDDETMKRATQLIDLGPGAGVNGGNIVANTSGKEASLKNTLKEFPDSPTLASFSEPLQHPLNGKRRSIPKVAEKDAWLKLTGCVHNNLKDIDVRIPIGRLTTISGVSGCGKSSLMRGTIPMAMEAAHAKTKKDTTPYFKKATGFKQLKYCYEVDQSPIGKTSRSCPATYVKILDDIRKLFAVVPESRMRGYTASRFSFNNAEGQCSECKGNGRIKLEMDFLPTTWVPCHACNQKRYNQATLEILYNGKTIGDVLEMNISTAAEFFKNHTKLHRTLSLLDQTGLGYLQLGQASPTLSGGEAQRLKLVAELTKGRKSVRNMTRQHTNLYLIEEPTIGLHQEDVKKLIDVLQRLVDEGHTVIVIEHHTAIMAEADYLIDMGPEAGENGGTIVAQGTPNKVAKSKTSRTAPFLAEALG